MTLSRVSKVSSLLSFAVLGLALILWSYTVINADLAQLSDYGLITALPWTYSLCVILASIIYFWRLNRQVYDAVFILALGSLFVFFVLTPGVIEGTPRFVYIYNAFGHGEYLAETGTVNLRYSYQSWPGLHFVNASLLLVTRLAPETILLWSAPLLQAFYSMLLYVLARDIFTSRTVACITLYLSLLASHYWVPQVLAVFFFLGIVWLGHIARFNRSANFRFALVILILALVPTHLLTSLVVAIYILLVQLGLARWFKSYSRTYLLLFVVVAISWQMYLTGNWVLTQIVNTFLTLLNRVNVIEDAQALGFSGSQQRSSIIVIRLIEAAMMALSAFAGFLLGVTKKDVRVWFLALGVGASIIAATLIGSYSGESFTRMYSFARPFFFILFAYFCAHLIRQKLWQIALLLALFFALLRPIVTWGNERIDYVYPSELASLAFHEAHKPSQPFYTYAYPQRTLGLLELDRFYGYPAADDKHWSILWIDGPVFETHRQYLGFEPQVSTEEFRQMSILYDNNSSRIYLYDYD